MRTAGYVSVFLTGALNPQGKIARDLGVFSKHLGAARTMMRFFDDLPMLTATLSSIYSKVNPEKLVSPKNYMNSLVILDSNRYSVL